MKKHSFNFFTIFSIFLILSSCSVSSNYYSIDYMEPGKITFPKRITHIAVLNNIHPKDITHQSENLAFTKTTAEDIFNGMISALAETDYFKQITIADTIWAVPDSLILPTDTFKKMKDKIDADLIISLEAVNALDQNIEINYPNPATFYMESINPFIQIYNTEKDVAFIHGKKDTIDITDSFILQLTIPNKNKRKPEDYTLTAGYLIGRSIAKDLTPHWKTESRLSYTDEPPFALANKAVKNNDFDKALLECENIYNNNSKMVYRIKAAYNAAGYAEISDQIELAYEWIQKALTLAQEYYNIDMTSTTTKLKDSNDLYVNCLLYSKLLKQRFENKEILNQQMNRFVIEN
ncbi:hypothetical protein Bcop_2413 [Bacteroides coprosuis DSM 18011]|uniref:Tetratricopeptide repeat protein n=1 Tax=Bacteroides coprosuis DSM 18011 TaxID=679937 RepID=F3ZNN0_9BACE|nr:MULTISPECIES: DUF6340 family protein [Bacteroides]EGJ72565.1 hypothetical protein Bcop_2413 [Bacteroides coprosuis DSM 18011]